MAENPQTDDRDRLIGSIALNYQIANGLNAALRTGSDIYRQGVAQFYARGAEQFATQGFNGGFRLSSKFFKSLSRSYSGSWQASILKP